MNEISTPHRGDAGRGDEASAPTGGRSWTVVLVSVIYALAALLGSAAAVITALSGWDRI